MAKLKPRPWTVQDYDRAAAAYLRRLPLEHFMEAIPAATQREITVASFAVLRRRCPKVQVFNELLIQYWDKGRLRRVVPDNMVRLCAQPPTAESSYNLDMEPVGPLLVLEYVSASNPRKDYRQNFVKYERELVVPYYLLFYPERQDLRVYRLAAGSYEQVPPNTRGRLEIPELELEVALLDGWVRYWHRGELLELPGQLEQQLEAERQRADQERQRADQERQRADQERQRADQAQTQFEEERQRRETAERHHTAAETELAQLRAELARLRAAKSAPRRPRKDQAGDL